MITGDNERFLRYWYECNRNSINHNGEVKHKWFFYHKGGEYRKWYGNIVLVVNWENGGYEITNFKDSNGRLRSRPQNIRYYLREGFTWTSLTVGDFNSRYMPPGSIFDAKGSSGFSIDEKNLFYLIALSNSKPFMRFLEILCPTMDYNAGSVGKVPAIISLSNKSEVDNLARENVDLVKIDWNSYEISWDFVKHPFLVYDTNSASVAASYRAWENFIKNLRSKLKSNEEELNRIFIDIYGLQDELTPEVDDKDITIRKADLGRDVRSFLSYAVGCMFGRYSLDVDGLAYASGEWDSTKYTTFIPDKDNVIPITDEEYFEDDVVGLFCAFLKKTFGEETLEENLDFIAKALGNKGNTSREVIRNYFLKDFYKDHCKIYQKRPIYWLFDSGKADGFKALVYMHRYNADTIGNLRIDYLHRMQRVYDSEIARMQETIDNSGNAREVAAATKRKEKLTKQLKETKEYDEKIAHLALARIEIDLDDGVKVNYEKVQTAGDGKKYEILAKI